MGGSSQEYGYQIIGWLDWIKVYATYKRIKGLYI